MTESKRSTDKRVRKTPKGDASAEQRRRTLAPMQETVAASCNTVLTRMVARDHRRANWARAHGADFYHEVLRGLMRLAYCAAVAKRSPQAASVDLCGRGLRLGQSFQPHELQAAGHAMLQQAASLSDGAPHEGLPELYQHLLGLRAHIEADELTLDASGRTRRSLGGSFFTPRGVVDRLLDLTLDPLLHKSDPLEVRICDPSCGGGNFLVAAAERIAQRLESRRSDQTQSEAGTALDLVMMNCIYGVDLDPAAAELCRFMLWMKAPNAMVPWRYLERSIRIGDALVGATPRMAQLAATPGHPVTHRECCDNACYSAMQVGRGITAPSLFHWHLEFAHVFSARRSAVAQVRAGWQGGFDLVIGNPPFLNRLEDATANNPAMAAFLRTRFGGIIRCYADAATAFWLLSSQLLRPGGRLALIQPQSILASRDSQPVRCELANHGFLEAIWFPTDQIFDASVRICAPVLIQNDQRKGKLRCLGNDFDEHAPRSIDMDDLALQETWSPLVSALLGIPDVQIKQGQAQLGQAEVVGDLATVTADFRDQYYGLRGIVSDRLVGDRDHPKLVTTGLIDMAHCAWGERPMRFDGQRRHLPRADISRLDPELQRWAASRLRPKLLVATQTRVIEAAVDQRGEWLPVTPLISVLPRSLDSLWLLAAAICAPPLAAIAFERHAGVALSSGAIKLSARQVAALPLPRPGQSWVEAAHLFQEASNAGNSEMRTTLLDEYAHAICTAYGMSSDRSRIVLDWWRERAQPASRRGAVKSGPST